MKNSLACPKCESRKLWRIEVLAVQDGCSNTVGERVPLVKNRGILGAPDAGRTVGALDLYLCASCAYCELWGRNFEGRLQSEPEQGVHLIDTTPQQSEYR